MNVDATALQYIDSIRTCPDCGTKGNLKFMDIPSSRRVYFSIFNVEHNDYFQDSRDYRCFNCDCEFTLTSWEP